MIFQEVVDNNERLKMLITFWLSFIQELMCFHQPVFSSSWKKYVFLKINWISIYCGFEFWVKFIGSPPKISTAKNVRFVNVHLQHSDGARGVVCVIRRQRFAKHVQKWANIISKTQFSVVLTCFLRWYNFNITPWNTVQGGSNSRNDPVVWLW